MATPNTYTVAKNGPQFFLTVPNELDPTLPRDRAQLLDLVDPATLVDIMNVRPDMVTRSGRYGGAGGVYTDYRDGSKLALPWRPAESPDEEQPPIQVEGDADSTAHRLLRIAYQMRHEEEVAAREARPQESGENFAHRILGGFKYEPKD